MKIFGFQKMTLLDYPGRVACTVFTGGCNFRCPFCHNASLVTHLEGEVISPEEIYSYLEKRNGLLDGVCITGGEPLLQSDIEDFIRKIKAMGYSVKLDTNGAYPHKLRALIDEKLVDYVAMDIKNSKEKYAQTIGVPNFDLSAVDESVKLLKEGKVDWEFRTTLVKELHEKEDIEKISRWICGTRYWYLQSFKDSGDVIQNGLSSHDEDTLKSFQSLAAQVIEGAALRGV